jgi:hypothetical protein
MIFKVFDYTRIKICSRLGQGRGQMHEGEAMLRKGAFSSSFIIIISIIIAVTKPLLSVQLDSHMFFFVRNISQIIQSKM